MLWRRIVILGSRLGYLGHVAAAASALSLAEHMDLDDDGREVVEALLYAYAGLLWTSAFFDAAGNRFILAAEHARLPQSDIIFNLICTRSARSTA